MNHSDSKQTGRQLQPAVTSLPNGSLAEQDPARRQEPAGETAAHNPELRFDVGGMTCAACQVRVEKAVAKVPGVNQVAVNLLTNSMQVHYNPDTADAAAIIEAVDKAGYSANIKPATTGASGTAAARPVAGRGKRVETVQQKQARLMKRRFWSSAAFTLPLLIVAMGPMLGMPLPAFFSGAANTANYAFLQLLLTLPVIVINRSFFLNGFKALGHLAPNMDSLVALGAGAALAYGILTLFRVNAAAAAQDMDTLMQLHHNLYFESAATILTLITLGKFLEARSKSHTTDSLTALMNLAPETALVERGGQAAEIPLEQVKSGDIVQVKSNSRIPVDGVIISGSSSVDESAITGESLPVDKHEGDWVTGATMNTYGFIRVEARRVGEDSTLAKIIRLVEDAGGSKAPIAHLADKIAGVFVPVVMGIALLTLIVWLLLGYGWSFALNLAIAVLVISCPCALGLATPVALMVGTGRGAAEGILIKSGEALETAQGIQTVVLDKTGTLTEGRPQVTDIYYRGSTGTAPSRQKEEGWRLLQLAAALEQGSEHPLAKALTQAGRQAEASYQLAALPAANHFASHSGLGVTAELGQQAYALGNRRFMISQGALSAAETDGAGTASAILAAADHYEQDGKTTVFLATDGKLEAVFALADQLRPSSVQAVKDFQKLGLEVVMLTGDKEGSASAIARQAGVNRYVAEVLPADKEAEVRRLQAEGRKVAMIGDGINDAPALVRADTGIAIGAGTDVALDAADVVLMHSDLRDAVTAIELSRATLRNIKENLFWAFIYNVIGIPLAAGVWYPAFHLLLNPMFAAAAMSLSSVFVVTNALRLTRFKPAWRKPGQSADQSRELAGQAGQPSSHQADGAVALTQINLEADESQPAAGPAQADSSAAGLKPAQSNHQTSRKEDLNMSEKTVFVEGMSCNHCRMAVEKALSAVPGVSQAKVDLAAKQAKVETDGTVTDAALTAAVTDAGYSVARIEA
ncbi:heavy metal translocating P-type ATPase [Oscillospiraceae bacterium HV4-5-C5C]|nr:heavy metal translocating P-type ATPase [Oscillospiraceae bacterium HV4-5-C5C]